jgi:hypothetical protein
MPCAITLHVHVYLLKDDFLFCFDQSALKRVNDSVHVIRKKAKKIQLRREKNFKINILVKVVLSARVEKCL